MKKQTRSQPAASKRSTPSSTRKRPPRRTAEAVASGIAGSPCPATARPASPWDPEPIFHHLVEELHFDPRDAQPVL